MPKLKLTKTAVGRLSAPDPGGRPVLHWDTELKGFGVLCSGRTNAKTYVVQRDFEGRTRRVTIGPTNVLSLPEAQERAKLVLADLYQGIDPKAKAKAQKATGMTLQQVLDDYLTARKALRPKTIHDYRGFVERYLVSWLAKPLRDITPEMVEARHQEIQKEVAERAQSNMTKGYATANATMRVFRILWNHAAERIPNLPDNPVKRLRRAWYPDERRENLISASDLPAFYDALTNKAVVPNSIQRDYILAILFTGLRRSEAASLRWEDIDLDQKIIRLPAARTKAGRKLDLPMSDYLVELFVARRAQGIDGPYVFPADSRSGHLEEPRFALEAVEAATGIKSTVHDLRRTFVTVAESCDIPIYALKGLVNHSLGNDVTAGYVVAGPERLRKPMQRVTSKLKELIGIAEPETRAGHLHVVTNP